MANCAACGRQVTSGLVVCRECAPPRWVSVEERLPETQQRVVARLSTGEVVVGWMLWGEWMTDFGARTNVKVTHWTPLPKPPRRGASPRRVQQPDSSGTAFVASSFAAKGKTEDYSPVLGAAGL